MSGHIFSSLRIFPFAYQFWSLVYFPNLQSTISVYNICLLFHQERYYVYLCRTMGSWINITLPTWSHSTLPLLYRNKKMLKGVFWIKKKNENQTSDLGSHAPRIFGRSQKQMVNIYNYKNSDSIYNRDWFV
jgi:hypothetical protein